VEFNQSYFQKYAGRTKAYDEIFLEHSAVDQCLDLFDLKNSPLLKSICVLGAATGRVLEYIFERSKIIASGCELSPWAFEQIPQKFQSEIELMDMRHYVKQMPQVDLVFTNALMYLNESDLMPLLKQIGTHTQFIHFHGSFYGDSCPDPYRKILKSLAWWKARFIMAGFKEVRARGRKETYLWTL
jgi:hypothetical protein